MHKELTQANGNSMPTEDWLEIRDSLTLALDGIETGPLDFIGLRQCVHYQREALRASHRHLEAMR